MIYNDLWVANAIKITTGWPWYYDWQEIILRVSVINTTSTTVNVDWKWAKSLYKKNDQQLVAWDLEAWSIIKIIYNNWAFRLISSVSKVPVIPAPTFVSDDFSTMDTMLESWTWTITYSENITAANTISFKKTIDDTNAGWTITVDSWLTTDTITYAFTAPNYEWSVYIENTVTWISWWVWIVVSTPYELFPA